MLITFLKHLELTDSTYQNEMRNNIQEGNFISNCFNEEKFPCNRKQD